MSTQTAEQDKVAQLEVQHAKDVDTNRRLDPVEYKTGEKVSDEVYEVTTGKKILPGGIKLGPGQRFHPTERQIANGSLRNKAVPVDPRDVKGRGRKSFAVGIELLGKVPMSDATRAIAVEAGLRPEDFKDVKPAAKDGYSLKEVHEIIEAKQKREGE